MAKYRGERHAALCDWLTANGIDTHHVPVDSDLTIHEEPDGSRVLRYEAFVLNEQGHKILDERWQDAAVEQRSVPLVVEPPAWWQPYEKPTREQLQARVAELEAERDGAYRERAHLLAWLAAVHEAVIAPAPDVDEPGWQIAYVYAGGWQMSWHVHPRDADLFEDVEHVPADHPRAQWDGHSTDAKYARMRAHTRVLLMNARLGERAPGPDTAGTEDTCRPVQVDGETIRARGVGNFTERDERFAAEIVRAAKRKYATEHPEENTMTSCTATIEGPHIPGGGPIQCDLDAHPLQPETHVGPKQEDGSRVLWTDHHAGATPHSTEPATGRE